MKEKLSKALMINNSKRVTIEVLAATIISSLLSYYFMIVDGYTCPDGICEGLTYYTN